MAHLHITGWVLAIILLFVVSSLYKKNNGGGKVPHMILRLSYLIILISGIVLFFQYETKPGLLFVKIIAGLWVIVSMEMITVRTNKQKPTSAWWIQFVIVAAIAIYLGFGKLPLGVLP